ILFITFIVILVTLVFQGLTLPWVIRKVKPEDRYTAIPEQKQEKIIQKKLALASRQFLEEKYGGERTQNEHLNNLFARLEIDLKFFDQELEEINGSGGNSLNDFQTIYLEMLDSQRNRLNEMNRLSEFDEDLIRKYLSLIDVEEFKIREKQLPETGTD
ncbi:MAG TPA: hypothetical protein VNB22_09620, partial [Pyrinomonadaceae bacterium]|nr:hypothetical protein [Pyrinomonadaceae bacterium]